MRNLLYHWKYEWIEGFDHGLSRVRTHGLTGYTKILQPYLTMIGMKLRIENH